MTDQNIHPLNRIPWTLQWHCAFHRDTMMSCRYGYVWKMAGIIGMWGSHHYVTLDCGDHKTVKAAKEAVLKAQRELSR